MGAPTVYKESVTVPLPSDSDIRAVIGEDYDPATRLNVLKMFAGTEEFYPVLVGMVRAIFGTPDIDDKHREMIISGPRLSLMCRMNGRPTRSWRRTPD